MRLEEELKERILEEFVITHLDAAELDDDTFLFGEGEGLGLDSIDAVELVMLVKQHYGIKITDRHEAREIFVSFRTLADYIRKVKAPP